MAIEQKVAPNSFNSNLIDALLDIRLALSIKKIVSPTIMKSEFRKILDDTKIRYDSVKDAIENVFDEYFPKTKKESNVIDFSEFVKKEEPIYEETGAEKGTSLVKRDGHFNSSGNGGQAA